MMSESVTPAKDATVTATATATEAAAAEVVSVDLPAPDGWRKKFIPKNGGTPRRSEIVFISPTGEEISSKRQLDQYLRAHPGGPPSSEFDWGTGDTPRRSARISAKVKATETPEEEKPKKRVRKSSGKKELKKDTEGEEEAAPDDAKGAAGNVVADDGTKGSADVNMKDAEVNNENINENTSMETEGELQKQSVDKPNDNTEQKTDGHVKNESLLEGIEEKKAFEILPPTSEDQEGGHSENIKTEDSVALLSELDRKENEDAVKAKLDDSAGKEIRDEVAVAENGSSKDAQESSTANEAQHPVSCEDGQRQLKASPVNC